MPVKKTQCIIDGQAVHSMADFYSELTRQLPFPPHFGNNLDALRDVLTTDISGPIQIVWNGAEVSRLSMGADFERAVALLREVAKERHDFQITLRG